MPSTSIKLQSVAELKRRGFVGDNALTRTIKNAQRFHDVETTLNGFRGSLWNNWVAAERAYFEIKKQGLPPLTDKSALYLHERIRLIRQDLKNLQEIADAFEKLLPRVEE